MLKFKCRITCVKVWMCLAVCGCLVTLILAAVVLSSYNFESVIGPLSCKLKRIETRNCCYDKDCIYGKLYQYYFSSNSTHCMDKFDIYQHPTNTSVIFTHSTGCHPSLKSLEQSSPNWYINDSVIFYVNKECTEWIHSSVHIDNVNKNLMWITIILSFVGCSCISMICGFLTMYHVEILTCFVDCCCSTNSICCCSNVCDFDDEHDDGDNVDGMGEFEHTNLKHQNLGHSDEDEEDEEDDEELELDDDGDTHHDGSSSSSEDGHHKYKPIGHGTGSSIPTTMTTTNMATHLSVQYALQKQHQHHHSAKSSRVVSPRSHHSHPSKNEMERTKMKDTLEVNTKATQKKGARGRGHSNASQISRLSPLSSTNDNEQHGWPQYQGIRQFVVDEGDEKYRAQQQQQQLQQQLRVNHSPRHVHNVNHNHNHTQTRMTKQLKHRVYNHLIQNMNGGDHTNHNGYDFNRGKFGKSPQEPSQDGTIMSEDQDVMGSTGLSDSVYFENEWYDENATTTHLTSPKRSNAGTSRQSSIGGAMDQPLGHLLHLKDRRAIQRNGNRKQPLNEDDVDEEEDEELDDQEHDEDDVVEDRYYE